MERDDFTCQKCWATDKMLHVHHAFYISGREPWEYCSSSLVTLCNKCHTTITEKDCKFVSPWENLFHYNAGVEVIFNEKDGLQGAVSAFSDSNDMNPVEILGSIMNGLKSGKITKETLSNWRTE